MDKVLHIPYIVEKILFDARDSMRAAGVCRAMRDVWRRPPSTRPSPFAVALVEMWRGRGVPVASLIRVCTFPIYRREAWLRATGHERPRNKLKADEAIGELAIDVLQLVDGDGMTLANIDLEHALQVAASHGMGGVVTAIIAWQKHHRQPRISRLTCWSDSNMLMTLAYGIRSGSVNTMHRLMWDIIDAIVPEEDDELQQQQDQQELQNGEDDSEDHGEDDSEDDEGVHEGDDDDDGHEDNDMLAMVPPPADILHDLLNTINNNQINGLERTLARMVLDAAVVAVLSAVNTTPLMLDKVVDFLRDNFDPQIVKMCMIWAMRYSLEQPIDNYVRLLVERGCIRVGSTVTQQALTRASAACLRYILSQQYATTHKIPSELLRWCVIQYAISDSTDRLHVLMTFWAARPDLGDLADAAEAATRAVRRMATINSNTQIDRVTSVISPHLARLRMSNKDHERPLDSKRARHM